MIHDDWVPIFQKFFRFFLNCYLSLFIFVMSCTPTQRIRFIQAAKEGNIVNLKKYVEDGIPVNTNDNCGVLFFNYF